MTGARGKSRRGFQCWEGKRGASCDLLGESPVTRSDLPFQKTSLIAKENTGGPGQGQVTGGSRTPAGMLVPQSG